MTKTVKLTQSFIVKMTDFLEKEIKIKQDYLCNHIVEPTKAEGERYARAEVFANANTAKIYDSNNEEVSGTSFIDQGGEFYCLNDGDEVEMPIATASKLIDQGVVEEVA